MFGFGRSTKINLVLEALEEHTRPLGTTAARIFSRSDIEELLKQVDDVATVVAMLIAGHTASMAKQFVDRINYGKVVEELAIAARSRGEDVGAAIEKEADEQYETAKNFGEEFIRNLDDGKIVGTPEVRAFLAENLTRQLASWALYRLRLLEARDESIGAGES